MARPSDAQLDAQLQLCIALARYAHLGQVDKLGADYIGHPLRVMALVSDPLEHMAAVLHDVLEETWVTNETLFSLNLPACVIQAIEAVTKRPGLSFADYLAQVKANPLALRIKIADTMDNLSPTRVATWQQQDPAAAEQYYCKAKARLAELCQHAGQPVPQGL